jgi:hypothetical protein
MRLKFNMLISSANRYSPIYSQAPIAGPLLFHWFAKNIPPAKFYHFHPKFSLIDFKPKTGAIAPACHQTEPFTNLTN